jgi:hypothetical protein
VGSKALHFRSTILQATKSTSVGPILPSHDLIFLNQVAELAKRVILKLTGFYFGGLDSVRELHQQFFPFISLKVSNQYLSDLA